MDEKIINTIALHQMTIKELEEIKKVVENNTQDDVKFIIQTRYLATLLDAHIIKRKTQLDISNYTMNLVLDEAIKQEKEKIDKLIDMEVDTRIAKCRIKE